MPDAFVGSPPVPPERPSSFPHTSCVLCTVPRSGSWLLSDLVDQTDLGGHPEEYFRPDFRRLWAEEWDIPATGPYDPYIRAALANTSTPNGVFGVKLHWYQLEWFVERLREIEGSEPTASDSALIAQWLPDPRYVHLHRDDTAAQAVSYYCAAHTDVWFVIDDDDPDAEYHNPVRTPRSMPVPDEPDFGHIRWFEDILLRHEQAWCDYFARSGIVPLEIRYEDFVGAYQATVRQVLEYCDIPVADDLELPLPRLKKQADERSARWATAYAARRDDIEAKPFRADGKAPVPRQAEAAPDVAATES